jgi:hypothetical protein
MKKLLTFFLFLIASEKMKKIISVILVINIFYSSYGQEFLGIKVEGKKDAVINAFKLKGFKIATNSDMNRDVVRLEGMAGGNNIELAIVCSPKSKTVWKFSVYLPAKTSWNSLERDYEDYLKILTDKYGEPKSKYAFFSSPYENGDGYEMTAVSAEKCTYSAFWPPQIGVSIKITKYKQVNISYENAINSALDDKETSEVNKAIF